MSDTHVKYEEMSQMSHIKLARRSETHCNRIKSLGHTLKVFEIRVTRSENIWEKIRGVRTQYSRHDNEQGGPHNP